MTTKKTKATVEKETLETTNVENIETNKTEEVKTKKTTNRKTSTAKKATKPKETVDKVEDKKEEVKTEEATCNKECTSCDSSEKDFEDKIEWILNIFETVSECDIKEEKSNVEEYIIFSILDLIYSSKKKKIKIKVKDSNWIKSKYEINIKADDCDEQLDKIIEDVLEKHSKIIKRINKWKKWSISIWTKKSNKKTKSKKK